VNNVLTLITASPGDLSDGYVDDIIANLRDLGAETGTVDWLSPSEACDIPFDGLVPEEAEAAVRSKLPLDRAVQPIKGRRKKLLLADMDSTIVTSETLDELADYAGLKDKIAAITARAMNGELEFQDALYERVAMLKGLDAGYLDKTMGQIAYTPGAATLVRTMNANGAHTALVSGGFRYFTGKVQDALGFDFETGNQLEVQGGKITGRVIGEIVDKTTKLNTLHALTAERGITLFEALTVGDGANDLPMLQAAGLGVAFHAKPVVINEARFHVEHAGLEALLFFQGYRRGEFVS